MATFNSANFGSIIPGYTPPAVSFLTVKVSDVLYSAARLARILLAPQRQMSSDEQVELLSVFNDFIDQMNAQRLTVLSVQRLVMPVNSSQGSYSLGPTGTDWVMQRPPKIDNASIISLENPSQPLEIPLVNLTADNWQLIPQKNVTSSWPLSYWYDNGSEWLPNAVFNLWPVPSIANQVALYAWTQIAQQSSVNTILQMAPAYKSAIQYGIAVEACIRWGKPVPVDVRAGAIEFMAKLKSVNIPVLDLRCDDALIGSRGWWNYKTGGFSTVGNI
jgi:hypothetical protein